LYTIFVQVHNLFRMVKMQTAVIRPEDRTGNIVLNRNFWIEF